MNWTSSLTWKPYFPNRGACQSKASSAPKCVNQKTQQKVCDSNKSEISIAACEGLAYSKRPNKIRSEWMKKVKGQAISSNDAKECAFHWCHSKRTHTDYYTGMSKSNVYNVYMLCIIYTCCCILNRNRTRHKSEYTIGIFHVLIPHFQWFTHNQCQSFTTDVCIWFLPFDFTQVDSLLSFFSVHNNFWYSI